MTTTQRPPTVFTGTHGPEDGAGAGTPWPDDVPPDQDDTWYPLRDDPWRARRMEYVIAAFWAITALCGLGLMSSTGPEARPSTRAPCGSAPSPAWVSGCCCGHATCCPGHDITASRGHHVSDAEERAAVVGVALAGHRCHDGPTGLPGEEGPGTRGRDIRPGRHLAARLARRRARAERSTTPSGTAAPGW